MFKDVIPDCAQILKLHTDPGTYLEWNVIKNDIDIPTKKGTATQIWVAWKTTDNQCWYSGSIWIEKTYEGAGTYGPAHAMNPGYGKTTQQIACENIK